MTASLRRAAGAALGDREAGGERTISAGICETRPSPTERRVKTSAASGEGMAVAGDADDDAARRCDRDDNQAGEAIARTNLEAPSMEPKKALSSPARGAGAGFLVVDQTGRKVRRHRHLLAGMASR